jgi:hypothetical protein
MAKNAFFGRIVLKTPGYAMLPQDVAFLVCVPLGSKALALFLPYISIVKQGGRADNK